MIVDDDIQLFEAFGLRLGSSNQISHALSLDARPQRCAGPLALWHNVEAARLQRQKHLQQRLKRCRFGADLADINTA
jgi:hypothetical protein